MKVKKSILGFIGVVVLSSATFFVYKKTMSDKFVNFTNENSYVCGRHEYLKDNGIAFSQSGTHITFSTNALEFSILIENKVSKVDTISNWFSVLLNNKYYSKLLLKPGKQFYPIEVPKNDTAATYITLVKSTESGIGEVIFYGVQIPRSAHCKKIDPLIFESLLNIQFIGNSITCGYGNMVSIPGPPEGNPIVTFNAHNENAFESYAMKTARKLDAVATLVSYSGKGLYRNFAADTIETIPKIYDRIHLDNKNSALWDHSKQRPDIIVINLGTNDYYSEINGNFVNDSVFVECYISFINRLIHLHPNAKIICVTGPMMSNDWPHGRKCLTRIENNIKKVKKHFKNKVDKKIYSFFFTEQTGPYGENYHPSLAVHSKMAEELTTFIKTVVNK